MTTNQTTPQKTILHDEHVQLQARLIDFHGWIMPVQYPIGIIAEHKNTRHHVSLFDVSHMGEFRIKGREAKNFLNYLCPNNFENLHNQKVAYSFLLNAKGTLIDDITIYQITPEEFLMCVNASNIEKDFQWIKEHSKNFQVELINESEETALIAIQGPQSIYFLQTLTEATLEEISYYGFQKLTIGSFQGILARMGYTGEEGFEFFIPKSKAVDCWNFLLDKGKDFSIAPAGLGARDTLRLEVCFPLYGNDLDEQHNAFESNLKRFVDMQKNDFIGKVALEEILKKGIEQKLVSFIVQEKGSIPRNAYELFNTSKQKIGITTSGAISPMLNYGIGMGYVSMQEASLGNTILVKQREKFMEATIVKPPFYKTKQKK